MHNLLVKRASLSAEQGYNRGYNSYDRTRDSARETKEDAKDTLENAKDSVKDSWYDTKRSAKNSYYETKNDAQDRSVCLFFVHVLLHHLHAILTCPQHLLCCRQGICIADERLLSLEICPDNRLSLTQWLQNFLLPQDIRDLHKSGLTDVTQPQNYAVL